MALSRPASQRVVFRPKRRVSWATRIFAFLVFLVAIAAVVYFLVEVLPARVGSLARMESQELAATRTGAASVNTSLTALWNDVGARGGMGLSDTQLAQDLALAKSTETAADDALAHAQAAETYLAEADGVPFQFHRPAFVTSDRPALHHLEQSLQTAVRLAHGATLQLTAAQHLVKDASTIANQLNPALSAHDWTQVASIASALQSDLSAESNAVANPEAFLDPLWGKWRDAMANYVTTAQQYALASAANQSQTAQQLARTLAAQSDQIAGALAAAQAGAASWQQKTIKPLLDTVAKELAAG